MVTVFKPSKYVSCCAVIPLFCIRGLKQVVTKDSTKMPPNKRFFLNNLSDNNESLSITQNWLVQNIQEVVSIIEKHERPYARKADGGLYVGIGGIAYMYYHLSKIDVLSDKRQEYLRKGLEYISATEKYMQESRARDTADLTGFLTGHAGINAVAAALYKEVGEYFTIKHIWMILILSLYSLQMSFQMFMILKDVFSKQMNFKHLLLVGWYII